MAAQWPSSWANHDDVGFTPLRSPSVIELPALPRGLLELRDLLLERIGRSHLRGVLAVVEGHAGQVVLDHRLVLLDHAVLFLRERGRQVERRSRSLALSHFFAEWFRVSDDFVDIPM